MMNQSEEQKFFVNSENQTFSDRQKNIFAKLDAVVKDSESLVNPSQFNSAHFKEIEVYKPVTSVNKKLKLDTKQFRGQESIFKRPDAPLPSRVKKAWHIPDHQKNPHKWTKYSLSDVSLEDMSDQSNTAAALSFLQELKSRRESAMAIDETDDDSKIKFRHPSVESRSAVNKPKIVEIKDSTLEESGLHFRNSKLIMPEYVVGQKRTNTKRNSGPKDNSEKNKKIKEIKLDHLTEDDGDVI